MSRAGQGRRMTKKRKKEILLEKLKETMGVVAYACEAAGISRVTYYNWFKEDEDFREKAENICEIQKDMAEFALLEKIKKKDTTAIIFYLKTKAKDRGYSERTEVTGADGADIAVNKKYDLSDLSDEDLAALGKILDKSNEKG